MDEHLKPLGLRVSSGAELLGCSESTVRRMLKSGELEGFRVRAGVRVDYDDLVRYCGFTLHLSLNLRQLIASHALPDALGETLAPASSLSPLFGECLGSQSLFR